MVLLASTLLSSGLTGCAWLDVEQRELALRPTPGRPAEFAPGAPALQTRFRPDDQRWTVEVPGAHGGQDRLALWWLPDADPAAPTLLYLHGTFRNLYQNLPKIDALREAGFSILAVDYRGWGDSTPIVPSEATITADAAVAWAELARRQPLPEKRVIYGHSMGGAVAVALAAGLHHDRDYGALVLESTFTNLPDVAAAVGVWGKLAGAITTLRFDSLSRIGQVDAPIWMLHGDADDTVPIALGRRLRDAARPGVHWVEIEGGTHSDLQTEAPLTYQHTFHDLIASLAPPAPRPAAPQAVASAAAGSGR